MPNGETGEIICYRWLDWTAATEPDEVPDEAVVAGGIGQYSGLVGVWNASRLVEEGG